MLGGPDLRLAMMLSQCGDSSLIMIAAAVVDVVFGRQIELERLPHVDDRPPWRCGAKLRSVVMRKVCATNLGEARKPALTVRIPANDRSRLGVFVDP
jgi:hypothetical protein